MRLRVRAIAAFVAALFVASCSPDSPTGPQQLRIVPSRQASAIGPVVRISEFHYDNASTDVGEAIEISGPVGTDLTGWQVVLYNGSGGAPYNTVTLSTSIGATCGPDATRGVVVINYPTNGIQNGAPDGIALVDNLGGVVELLSYEGSFTAVGGPANGLTLPDIGVSQNGSGAIGLSLQRSETGAWQSEAANTFGTCNDGIVDDEEPAEPVAVAVSPAEATMVIGATAAFTAEATDAEGEVVPSIVAWTSRDAAVASVENGIVTGVSEGTTYVVATVGALADSALVTVTAAPPVELPPVRLSEIHYDNFGTDVGEAIEVEGPAGTDLTGWRIVLYNGNGGASYDTKILNGTIANQCDGRGTLYVEYPSNGIQNGSPDGFALVNAEGVLVEFLSYEGTFIAADGAAAGVLGTDIGAVQLGLSAEAGTSLQRTVANTWETQPRNFGACYGQVPPPPANTITFSGRDGTDPALPIGFEDQLFATLRDGATSAVITTTWTWSTETPALASVDANGVVQALGAGTAVVRATAEDGSTATYNVPTRVASAGSALYQNHVEFGAPVDGDASNDIIVARTEFTSSWNPARGTPNWVAYNLDATHFGPEDRCDCFTFDPELAAYPRYTTADYTGAGAAAGYGIDRGHLARSFDRTAGSLDNARSFYFSNIIPQAADNNQGPWAAMENALGDLARFSNRELFIVAGVAGSKGTVKNEGKITIPAQVWKVALVLPRDATLASVTSLDAVDVIAVIMPNDPGIRTVDWNTYRTTVNAVEALSGYDLLSLLRDDLEIALESGTSFPVGAVDGPYSAYAGDAVAMHASATDADGDALSFNWSFGDGTFASGAAVSHTYAAAGSYSVRMIVTDILGLADTVETTATISQLPAPLAVERALAMVNELAASGALSSGEANSLRAKLRAAASSLERGNTNSASGQIGAALNELRALANSGRLTAAQVAPLVDVLLRGLDGL